MFWWWWGAGGSGSFIDAAEPGSTWVLDYETTDSQWVV
jgi:hypothetical protein